MIDLLLAISALARGLPSGCSLVSRATVQPLASRMAARPLMASHSRDAESHSVPLATGAMWRHGGNPRARDIADVHFDDRHAQAATASRSATKCGYRPAFSTMPAAALACAS